MLSFRLYYSIKANDEIAKMLADINAVHGISYELIDLSNNGEYDPIKEKQIYDNEFKPKAKILKKRTGHPIDKLRSRKAHNYFVSRPATLTIIGEAGIEWYSNEEQEIMGLFRDAIDIGIKALQNRCM